MRCVALRCVAEWRRKKMEAGSVFATFSSPSFHVYMYSRRLHATNKSFPLSFSCVRPRAGGRCATKKKYELYYTMHSNGVGRRALFNPRSRICFVWGKKTYMYIHIHICRCRSSADNCVRTGILGDLGRWLEVACTRDSIDEITHTQILCMYMYIRDHMYMYKWWW